MAWQSELKVLEQRVRSAFLRNACFQKEVNFSWQYGHVILSAGTRPPTRAVDMHA